MDRLIECKYQSQEQRIHRERDRA